MSKRKTVDIKELIEGVNNRNKISTCSPELRMGANLMLEDILHKANVYAGFGYYTAKDVPYGEKPGIIYGTTRNKGGVIVDNQFPDESRRFYYIHRSLNS